MARLTIAITITSTLLLWCILILHLQADTPTMPLTRAKGTVQQHNAIAYQHLIPSQDEINRYINEGKILAQKYTAPEFLEPIIHADKIRTDNQRAFNNTMLHEIPISQAPPLTLGVYNKDILVGSFLTAAWGLEWLFFHKLQQLIVAGKARVLMQHAADLKAIISSDDDDATKGAALVALLTRQSSVWHPLQNKALIGCVIAYASINLLLQSYQRSYLLHEQHTLSPGAPLPLTALAPKEFGSIMMQASPSGWLSTVTNFFDYCGFVPPWTQQTSWLLARDVGVLLGWLWWQEKRIINPIIGAMVLHDPALCAQDNTRLEQTLNGSLTLSFKTWLYLKTLYVGIGYTIVYSATALGATVNAGMWGYDFYKEIKATMPQHAKDV